MQIFFSSIRDDGYLLRELNGFLAPWISSWIDYDSLAFSHERELCLETSVDVDSDFVVLFVSRAALLTPWPSREIGWAMQQEDRDQRLFLLPIVVGDVREELEVLGLATRAMIELVDHTETGTKMLAEKLTSHFGGWMAEALRATLHEPPRSGPTGDAEDIRQIVEALAVVPSTCRLAVDDLLVRPLLAQLSASQTGRIPLSPPQYYQRILAEMAAATRGTEVVAVSTLTSNLWQGDVDQAAYARRNLAAVERGAVVRRIFVIPAGGEAAYRETLNTQLQGGIDVRVGSNDLFANIPSLQDFVMFSDERGTRAYLALPTIDGPRRIRSGVLDLSPHGPARLATGFVEAWKGAIPVAELLQNEPDPVQAKSLLTPAAPGESMTARFHDSEVFTPAEAAEARCTPLVNELQTLILRTHEGLVAAHLPGDGVVSLDKVGARMGTATVHLADLIDLRHIGLSPGTMSAVLEPIWSMPQLVTRRLLDLRQVRTNNGTRTGYFEFDPATLVEHPLVVVDDFEASGA
jgi:prolyl-tRNA editing enzyme YbaK/EbsC (Cys-tRNA(Pro) deacylase)